MKRIIATLYLCEGYWKGDPTDTFERIISDGTWNRKNDRYDEGIFFYTNGSPVMGDQGDFVITSAEVWD
jgi:hypothetical protein